MIERRSLNGNDVASDTKSIEAHAGGPIDVAVVLGSGLSGALEGLGSFTRVPYEKLLGMPLAKLEGHVSEALIGTWNNKRVLAYCGRVHLYQGFSAQQVTVSIRLAAGSGAKTVILTNAAGSLNEGYRNGDIMMISDHINLTNANPLLGTASENPFVSMHDAYSKHLRDIARSCDRDIHEGVYAGVTGPSYETPAEARFLRTIGADAVGMSTVLETITARSKGLSVLGFSVITNHVGGTPTQHDEVSKAAAAAAPRLTALIGAVLAKL